MAVVEKLIEWVATVLFVVIFVVAMAQIVMRWVFRSPLVWSEELIRLLFVWICYLGWAIASRKGSHIRITAVLSKLPVKGQLVMETFNYFLVILFSILMVVYGIKMSVAAAGGRAVSLPFITFAMVYAICPFSNATIVFYQVMKLIDLWTEKKVEVAR